jgi:hypothetical protein
MIRHVYYNKYINNRIDCYIQSNAKITIRMVKYNCKLCDLHTNHFLVYKRHLRSNNHYIRSNQF